MHHITRDIEANHKVVGNHEIITHPKSMDFQITGKLCDTERQAYESFWEYYRALSIPKGFLLWRSFPEYLYDKDKCRLRCRFNILPYPTKDIEFNNDWLQNDWLQDALLTETPYGGQYGR